MFTKSSAQALRDMIVICPRCQSVECHSNHIPNLSLSEAASVALDEQQAGHNRQALRLILGWAFVAAANATREPYACTHCREEFR
jgi:hypothetical protein